MLELEHKIQFKIFNAFLNVTNDHKCTYVCHLNNTEMLRCLDFFLIILYIKYIYKTVIEKVASFPSPHRIHWNDIYKINNLPIFASSLAKI